MTPTHDPRLTPGERAAITGDRWFGALPAALRHDMLRAGKALRYRNRARICARGDRAEHWCAVAQGAVRLGAAVTTARPMTLAIAGPGTWIGEAAVFDEHSRTPEAVAHGDTTLLVVPRAQVRELLARHAELYPALLQLHTRRLRQLFDAIEALSTLPLRARLLWQLARLAQRHGEAVAADPAALRITLRLAQTDLAGLVGATRQRVNRELKALERDRLIQLTPQGLVVTGQGRSGHSP